MKFSLYQESRTGARPDNQDRIGCFRSGDALLMVVADGMGGHLNGEVAAEIAVQTLAGAFRRDARPRLADPLQFLRQGFNLAHDAIVGHCAAGPLTNTPRTTCVACVVQDSIAYWAHAGDSRLYHIRGARIRAQTRDHSRVRMLIDRGLLREEEAGDHPDRNKIFSCLGGMMPPQVDVSNETLLQPGDTLVLCSDGLWGPIPAEAICAALDARDVGRAMPGLLDAAEAHAGRDCDNLSVVAITWAGACAGGAQEVADAMDKDAGT